MNPKPLIGICGEFRPGALKVLNLDAHVLFTSYTHAVIAAGGLPVVLPLAEDSATGELAGRLDGLLLTGDFGDMPPDVLKEDPHPTARPAPRQRYDSDQAWLDAARDTGMPILAICFGMQLLNVASRGTLYQDIASQRPESEAHITRDLKLDHAVSIEPASLLASMAPNHRVTVRSTHHQAVRDVAPGFVACARSDDGIVEAIENPNEAFVVGVQWHPELAADQPDWLIRGFVGHCTPGAPH